RNSFPNGLTAPARLASPDFTFEDTTMPNTSIQATGEAMPAEKKINLSPNLTRRRALGFLAAVGASSAGTVAVSAATATAQERFDHHLAELKKAAEELDPMIGSWHVAPMERDGQRCAVIITAFRVTGRYE